MRFFRLFFRMVHHNCLIFGTNVSLGNIYLLGILKFFQHFLIPSNPLALPCVIRFQKAPVKHERNPNASVGDQPLQTTGLYQTSLNDVFEGNVRSPKSSF